MRIGGIGSITSANSMQATQITASDLRDQKSKNLQDDITDVQREIQKLSSDEKLTVTEKAEEKEKLQKEKSNLDTKLKLHQDELLKSQKREIKLAELQEDRNPAAEEASAEKPSEDKNQIKETSSDASNEKKQPADDRHSLQPGTVITQNSDGTVILKEVLNQDTNLEAATETKQPDETKEEAASEKETKTAEADTAADTGLSEKEVNAMVSADTSMKQADRQGALAAKTNGDIAVLKSEIKQDAYRGVDTEEKQAELKDMRKQSNRETAFQFSLLNEANNAMQSAAETAERTFQVSGVNASQEDQALQQGFQVSIA